MNNTTNENSKPLPEEEQNMEAETQQSGDADHAVHQFFEETDRYAEAVTEEDPFFSPLPDIPLDEDESSDETDDGAVVGDPADCAETEEETVYIAERTLSDLSSDTDAVSDDRDAAQHTDGDRPRRAYGKVIGIAAGTVGGVILLTFAVLCILLFRLSGPITVDLDEQISLGALENHPILSALTSADPQPDDIDTSAVGNTQIQLTFFGLIPRTVPVSVCDLTLPAVTAYRMTVGVGDIPDPQDCVLRCDDKTTVTHTFAELPDTTVPGEYIWLLLSQDAGGNTVQTEVTASVLADACTQNIEFGTEKSAISDILSAAYPDYPAIDLTGMDETVCGTYRVIAQTDTDRAILSLVLSDTTAPRGKTHDFNLLSGKTLTPQDFVTNIRDASEVTLSYRTSPDYNSLAPQKITVAAVDAAGNETEFSCDLQIWNISDTLTAECGTTLDSLRETLFTKMTAAGAALPTFDASFDPAVLAPGTYSVRLHGKYSSPTVSLTMVDTVAPQITTSPLTAYVGHALTPDKFVTEITDATEVRLSFKSEPDTSKAGNITVTIVAEDAGGNKSETTETASVIADTAAPVIYGVKTIYAKQNGTVSYRQGVTAYDNADGNVSVKVNADGVDTSKIGKYTVIYTATDKAGNTATQSATVYVTGANQASVNLYADEILATITWAGMTDTQKASAIYNWCVGHLRYSTSTSHLMGKYLEAAYSGFTTHIGNCYTYYAVASALLTRAGIENIEIQRDNPYAPHYWNLVKINGNWYHLDTCPKWKNHEIKAFLLTDWQVRQYSINEVEGYYSFDASRYPATP